MPWFDGHLDLAYIALNGRDLTAEEAPPAEGCVTIPALLRGGVETAFATIFTRPGGPDGAWAYRDPDDLDGAEAAGLRQLELYEQLERDGVLRIVRDRDDLIADAPGLAPFRVILLMEGADPIRDPASVPTWAERGVRLVGLTWTTGTRYAGGNGNPGPLTGAGVELVAALDAAGVVHDASHLADAALDGLLEHATGPVVATHSNCRAITGDDQRHLRDDQIRAIGGRGGIVGLNLFTRFLVTGRRARVEDCLAHVRRVTDVMGHRRGVALGSDMDGGFTAASLPEGVDHPVRLERLGDALRRDGWSDEEIDGFRWRNWTTFLERALT